MPLVTVLLPVYNGEQYLQETIRSILAQSYRDFEFLIVDDGSTDKTAEIIAGFDDKRIRVLVNEKRLKLSGALNRGIEEARGDFIARMDADDLALTNRLQVQVDFLLKNKDVGICGSAIEVFGSTRTRKDIFPLSADGIKSYALFDCPFCHPSVMLRKELFNRHQLRYDGSYYPTEDYELWSRAIESFQTVNLKEVLLKYRVHEKSMTGADWDAMDRQATRVIRPRLERLGLRPSSEQLQFHRNIGRGRSICLSDIAQLQQAEDWLLVLLAQNRKQQCYLQDELEDCIRNAWFRLCMNSSSLGLEVVARYGKSKLAAKAFYPGQFMTLAASAFKNLLFPRKDS